MWVGNEKKSLMTLLKEILDNKNFNRSTLYYHNHIHTMDYNVKYTQIFTYMQHQPTHLPVFLSISPLILMNLSCHVRLSDLVNYTHQLVS